MRSIILRSKHVFKKAIRSLSTTSKKEDEVLISSLFENKDHGFQIAKLLSPSARLEIQNARNTILSNESKNSAQEMESVTEEPTSSQLRLHAFTIGIPFIGFGFMDNALMIVAGDYIDTHLGVLFGISTLCAAAIGNLVSDVAGVGLGAYVEDFCATKLKLPSAELNNAQRQLRSVRFAGNFGTAIGLTIGCILGMFPLLFIDPEEVQRKKKESQVDKLFRDVMTEAKSLVGADSTCLFLLVDKETSNIPSFHNNRDDSYHGKYLKSKYFISGEGPEKLDLFSPIGPGLVSKCIYSGEVLNVPNVHQDPAYEPTLSVVQHLHSEVKAMLLVPVYDVHGNVIAVLQATNKVRKGTAEVKLGFLQRLKSNISGEDQTRNQADVFYDLLRRTYLFHFKI
jgi:tRNA-specific adenosine deaminase 1